MIPKFRAWKKAGKELGRVGQITFELDGSVSCVLFKGKFLDFNVPINEIVLMQSTGLRDKNGKEIFEGDVLEIQGIKMIVKFGSYKYLETSKNNGHILGILHDGLGFYVECIDVADPDNISPFEPETLKNSQIIGNIYENRELLEDKE